MHGSSKKKKKDKPGFAVAIDMLDADELMPPMDDDPKKKDNDEDSEEDPEMVLDEIERLLAQLRHQYSSNVDSDDDDY